MQFTKIASVLALAITAIAAPTEQVVARNGHPSNGGGNPTPTCSNQNQVVSCCNGLGLLAGFCALNVLNCVGGNQMCCNNQSSGNSLISILDGACVGVIV